MKINLKDLPTKPPKDIDKEDIIAKFTLQQHQLAILQNRLSADEDHSLLIIFQGVDASGKDGVIRKVFSATNPESLKITSFKS
ncbi:MAG: hypothetical protein EOP53_26610 [Sphingobacteriales bacterium]|nr:MAG: hypothetical protein EOP53_26610 [Sphingobacteriales bacterium]